MITTAIAASAPVDAAAVGDTVLLPWQNPCAALYSPGSLSVKRHAPATPLQTHSDNRHHIG